MHGSQFIIQFGGKMGKRLVLGAALAAVLLQRGKCTMIGILAGGAAIAKAKI
jgi:hypothetical protein